MYNFLNILYSIKNKTNQNYLYNYSLISAVCIIAILLPEDHLRQNLMIKQERYRETVNTVNHFILTEV